MVMNSIWNLNQCVKYSYQPCLHCKMTTHKNHAVTPYYVWKRKHCTSKTICFVILVYVAKWPDIKIMPSRHQTLEKRKHCSTVTSSIDDVFDNGYFYQSLYLFDPYHALLINALERCDILADFLIIGLLLKPSPSTISFSYFIYRLTLSIEIILRSF